MFERGLSHRGLPLKRKFRPRCCARTRAGAPCIMRVVPGKRRCRFHGGTQNEGWSCPDRRGPAPTVAHLSRDRSGSQRQITGWRSRNSSQSVVVSGSE